MDTISANATTEGEARRGCARSALLTLKLVAAVRVWLCGCVWRGQTTNTHQVFYWDVASGNFIRKFRGHDSNVNAVCWGASDSVLLTAG